MKIRLIPIAIIAITLIAACNNSNNFDNPGQMKTFDDSASYFIGNSIGQQLVRDSLNINYAIFVKAIEDLKKNDTTYFPPSKVQEFMMRFQETMMAKQEAIRQKDEEKIMKEAEQNIVKAEKFLEENKKKPGVKVTPSGLQYMIITEGKGKKPTMEDMIEFHLRAIDMEGNVFDNTYERGEPIKIGLQGQVKGWEEAFQMMNEGSKWKIWLPPSLGWGERGVPGKIPPNSVTTFEIELISVNKMQNNQ